MVLLQSYVQIITVNPVHSTVLLQSHSPPWPGVCCVSARARVRVAVQAAEGPGAAAAGQGEDRAGEGTGGTAAVAAAESCSKCFKLKP